MKIGRELRSNYGNFESWFKPFNILTRMNNTTLATNETIFSVVTRLSNAMGSLPLKLYKDYKPVSASKNQIAYLIENSPNPYMTPFQWIRCMEAFRNTNGNAYALKRYNDNFEVISLDILDPNKVEPVIEKETKDLWYKINGENGEFYVHNMDMIHVNHIHTSSYKGISPLDVLKNTVDYDREVKEFSLNQMKNGLKVSLALKIATNLDPQKRNEYLNQFKTFYQNSNGVIVLDNGADIKEIKSDFIDPKVFEIENITIARVARVYNVPLNKLLNDKQSYSSAEQADLEYIKDTILPIVRMYEQELSKKLLGSSGVGYAFRFNLNGLARADMKTRGEFYFKGVRSAWFTPNEIRSLEELPPLDGGDKLYVSRDLIPIDKIDLILKGGEENGYGAE